MTLLKFDFLNKYLAFGYLFLIAFCVKGEEFPKAVEQAEEFIIGWNIGNSLEVPLSDGGESGWGNPKTTQRLIDSVKAQGFNIVRIPCAWNSYADQETFEIEESWLERVKEVVDYCLENDMFVMINSHWDGGWMEENPTYDMQEEVNEKHEAYWTQIAEFFTDYDSRLIFAGTNEVREDYGAPSAENIEVQESYNQTFVDAVRATGGNNTNRNLIVQTYNTNINHGLNHFSLPEDVVDDHLMVEVHYYDPYDFTLNSNSNRITWGEPFSDIGNNDNWGQENYVDDIFKQVKEEWVDKGYPVIMGEYGVIHRKALEGFELEMHTAAREYWLEYVSSAAIQNGILPVYWDNGWDGDDGFAIFDRSTGEVVDEGALEALMIAAGVLDPETKHTLTININGVGDIKLEPGYVFYDEGTEVTISAIPNTEWNFEKWDGYLSNSDNPVTVIMNDDISITANFLLSTTNVKPEEKGSINIYPNPSKNNMIRVELNKISGDSIIRIIDLTGKIINEKKIVEEIETFELSINAKSGMYILQLENNNNNTVTKKFTVK